LGSEATLYGTNGARDGLDVARMMLAGARGVEMTTAVLEYGFGALGQAVRTLDDWLVSRELTAEGIVGHAADALEGYGEQPSRPGYWREIAPAETNE